MTATDIMQMVAYVCGVTVEDMQGFSRDRDIIWAKYIAAMMLAEEGFSIPEIVAQFPRHHRTTTINRGRFAFEMLIRYDKAFKRLYLECVATYNSMVGDL